MIVDISKLESNCSIDFDFNETILLPTLSNLIENCVLVNGTGRITRYYNCYDVSGKLSGKIVFKCDKCLSNVECFLDFSFEEKFSENEDLEKDIYYFDGKKLDLETVLFENILTNMPVKVLCKEDCNGLCHICGQNLNEGSCGCVKTIHDPRFDVLNSLFNDKEV